MSLNSPNPNIAFLAAIIFLIMGIVSGSSGTLIAALVWFIIGLLTTDRN